MNLTYKDSGVDIDEGNSFVSAITPIVKKTFDKNVIGSIGSFAGAYALPSGFKDPVIMGATDGVGTKLRVAIDAGRVESIGIDLVGMCVNDLICNFATPMFFLDYFACAKLEKDVAIGVVSGISKGCLEAECALIGGETAEMPGMYRGGDFDLAGFGVGIAEREDLQNSASVGDILVALPSSGLHSNGYSLARRVLFEEQGLGFDSLVGGRKLVDVLLEPTRIYVKTFKALKDKINALAHITGGGIVENLPRVLGAGVGAQIDKSLLKIPEIFSVIAKNVSDDECFRVFNMGVGMILAIDSKDLDSVLSLSNGYVIGEVCNGDSVKFV